MAAPVIVWFRQDLRLADHPPLAAAIEAGGPVIPVYLWAPHEEGAWPPGGASRWWLHGSLAALGADLQKCGSRLILRRIDPSAPGGSGAALAELCNETGTRSVFWSRRYEPAIIARDTAIKAALKERGIHAESFQSNLLFEPHEVTNQQGRPFQVFSPFWKQCQKRALEQPCGVPLAAPQHLTAPAEWPSSADLAELELLPRIDWAAGMRSSWTPGEASAERLFLRFIEFSAEQYHTARDLPGAAGTSRLSPHLHFGEISPRQIWHQVFGRFATQPGKKQPLAPDAEHFLREVGWREFAYHLLYHFPHTPEEPLREHYRRFPWRNEAEPTTRRDLRAWQRGRTGYPIVDAGMRELWRTGWMHNRVRMIVASFLVKHLLIRWQAGAAWFWDTLVDADLASNTLGWQWTAGCGADAAPYFRIFNPITQGEKFDGTGAYVRKWVPEIAALPDAVLHRPWEATHETLKQAGVVLGTSYPQPIVEHMAAREAALAALDTLNH